MDSTTTSCTNSSNNPTPPQYFLINSLLLSSDNNANNNNIKITKLTISDDHVNFLIENEKEEEEEEENKNKNGNNATNSNIKSILKLNLFPLHKHILSTTTDNESTTEGYLKFLRNFHWNLSSESGAEYSYYKLHANEGKDDDDGIDDEKTSGTCWGSGFLKSVSTIWEHWWQQQSNSSSGSNHNNKHLLLSTNIPLFSAELISPASSKQISRVMPSDGYVMIEETPQMYNQYVKPYIDDIAQSGSLDWVKNIVTGSKEIERLLINRKDWILNIDTKWRTHPNPLTIPRSEWYNHPSTEQDLYCLGIVKDNTIRSIRDLRGDNKHIPLLQEMIDIGSKTIFEIYGIPKNQLRIFVHYQPQFYWFHVHYTRLENEIGTSCERGHLLTDIIQNLQMKSTYYEDKTITYKLNRNDKLYHKLLLENPSSSVCTQF